MEERGIQLLTGLVSIKKNEFDYEGVTQIDSSVRL